MVEPYPSEKYIKISYYPQTTHQTIEKGKIRL